MCSRRGGGLFIGDVRQYAFTYAREKRALHTLALARPARERRDHLSFSLCRTRFFRSPRRSTFRRCIAALEMAYGIAYWSEGRASAAITVLLPAGFCGCTSARLPFLSPDATRRTLSDVAYKRRKFVINAFAFCDQRKTMMDYKIVGHF